MAEKDILRFIETNEKWATVQDPQSDIMSYIKKGIQNRPAQLLQKMLFFRRLSMGLAAVLVVTVGLIIAIPHRHPTESKVIVLYPAVGNEKEVKVTAGKKTSVMHYQADNQLYITELNGQMLTYKDLKINIVRDEAKGEIPYERNIQPEEKQVMIAKMDHDDNPAANNQENELDGLYVPGLGSDLLASAKLEF